MSVSTLDLLNVTQAAELLGLSAERVGQFCREGRIGQKVGERWVIPRDELEQFRKIPRQTGRPAASKS
jgi:excisionase family DNA binding protein